MSKFFYKDIQLIKFCKYPGCNVEYRPQRFSFFASLGLCYVHRRVYYRTWYINHYMPWWNQLSPERQAKRKAIQYGVWKKWVAKHHDKRKKQALASYHKNKDKHRHRSHHAKKPQRSVPQ